MHTKSSGTHQSGSAGGQIPGPHSLRVGEGDSFAVVRPAAQLQTSSQVGRETLEKLYSEGLGLEGMHSPHAWRTSFSTLERDVGEIDRDVIDAVSPNS